MYNPPPKKLHNIKYDNIKCDWHLKLNSHSRHVLARAGKITNLLIERDFLLTTGL